MTNLFKLKTIFFLISFCISFLFARNLLAQELPPDSIQLQPEEPQTSLGVSPAILELILEPGIQTRSKITVFNNTRFPLPIKGTVQNFIVNEEFLPDDKNFNKDIYDASGWFKLEPAEFILQSGQSQDVEIVVEPPKFATPGGHYATIFFQPLIPEDMITGSATHLTARIGTIVLSIVKGDIVEKATIGRLETPISFYRTGPVLFKIPIANEGNLHVLPNGKIYIRNFQNKTVQELELQSANIMPNTFRVLEASWDKKYLFGKYTALAEIKYGPENKELISNPVTFWVFPWLTVTIAVILLTAFSILFRLTYKNFFKALKVLFEQET